MKNIIFMLVLSIFLNSCTNQTQISEKSHIGYWSGYDSDNSSISLELKEDGTAKISANGSTYDLTYKIDYSQKPIQLDLFPKEGQPMLGIIEFVSDKMMKHCINFSGDNKRFSSVEEAGIKNCINFEKK